MKKTSSFMMVTMLVFSISCRKDLTCECTYTKNYIPSGGGSGSSFTKKIEINKSNQKKKEFRETTNCYNTISTQTVTNGTEVITNDCELK